MHSNACLLWNRRRRRQDGRAGVRRPTLVNASGWCEMVVAITGMALLLSLLVSAAVVALASAENATYVITWANASSGWCVDLSGGDTSNGTEIQLWDCNVSTHRAISIAFVTAHKLECREPSPFPKASMNERERAGRNARRWG